MNVKVYYASGKIATFDTSELCAPEPYKREYISTTNINAFQIAAEAQLRFDLPIDQGLVIETAWYDGNIITGNDINKTEYFYDAETAENVYIAARRPGRFIPLVDPEEFANVVKITCDGELIAWRQGKDLINGIKFAAQALLCFSDATTSSINKQAVALAAYLRNANPESSDEDIAEMLGYSEASLNMVRQLEAANDPYGSDDEDYTDVDRGADLLESEEP